MIRPQLGSVTAPIAKIYRHGVSHQHREFAGTFVLKSGALKIYIKTAESGGKRAHAFCPECGTPIYAAAPEPKPTTYAFRVGAIEQRAQFAPPIRQIWCRSALPWSMDLTGVERAQRQ